jgi:hypothetical protein
MSIIAPRDNRLVKKQHADAFPNLFDLTQSTQPNVITYEPNSNTMNYQSISTLATGTTTTGTLSFGIAFTGTVNYSLYTAPDGTKQLTLIGQTGFPLTKLTASGVGTSQSIPELVPSSANVGVSAVLIGINNTGPTPPGKLYMAQINTFGQVIIASALDTNNALGINENFQFNTSVIVYR